MGIFKRLGEFFKPNYTPKDRAKINAQGAKNIQKAGQIAGKALQAGADLTVNPIGRALLTPVATIKSGIESAVPGGKTGNEPMASPFGDVKPMANLLNTESRDSAGTLKPGEAVGQAVDLATTFLPAEKIAAPFLKVADKVGGLGKGIVKKGAIKFGELLTGVDKPVLKRWSSLVADAPEVAKQTIQHVVENPDNPFLSLAKHTAAKLQDAKDAAKAAWRTAAEQFTAKNADKTFDVSDGIFKMGDKLREDFNVAIKAVKDEAGKATGAFEIVKKGVKEAAGKPYGLAKKEVENINELLGVIKNAKNETAQNLPDLLQEFDSFYNRVPLDNNGNPTKYHAMVMALKQTAEEKIDSILPPALKGANEMFKDYYRAMDAFGNKIIDAQGNVKTGAESFLKNVKNLNKGALREGVQKTASKLSQDVLGEVERLNDAMKLTAEVPSTVKNRTMDFIRGALSSKFFAGAGGAATIINPIVGVPMVLSHVLSSPKNYRAIIELVSKEGKPTGKAIEAALQKLSPEAQIGLQNLIKVMGRMATGGGQSGQQVDENGDPLQSAIDQQLQGDQQSQDIQIDESDPLMQAIQAQMQNAH